MKQLNKGKDDGNHGFKYDHLIQGGHRLYTYLSILFNAMIRHGYNPRELLLSSIISIPKDMKSWTFFSKGLSFNGRVLVVNSLCASKLWYIISVLQPPQNYISSLQKAFIDFVWHGRHWVKSDILYLRKSQGGLGLVHILSRLHAFRLRFIHEYLYYDRHSCFRIANVFLEEFITLDILNSYSFLCL